MKFSRPDYQESIIDLRTENGLGGIPADEPVFLLRAKDICAPLALMDWIKHVETLGGSSEILNSAREQAENMLRWRMDHKPQIPTLPGEKS